MLLSSCRWLSRKMQRTAVLHRDAHKSEDARYTSYRSRQLLQGFCDYFVHVSRGSSIFLLPLQERQQGHLYFLSRIHGFELWCGIVIVSLFIRDAFLKPVPEGFLLLFSFILLTFWKLSFMLFLLTSLSRDSIPAQKHGAVISARQTYLVNDARLRFSLFAFKKVSFSDTRY